MCLKQDIEYLERVRDELKDEIIELDDEVLFQSFGVYTPLYDFANLDDYKSRLQNIRGKQKDLIANKQAVIVGTQWKVNGSEQDGKAFIAECTKQMLRNFNIESEICIDKVKFYNYDSIKERIRKAFETQNKLNTTNDLKISDQYYNLKIDELNLSFEYQQKKKEEKDRLREKREELREQERVAREIEEKRKEYQKEQNHYLNMISRLDKQIDEESSDVKKQYMQEKIEEIAKNLDDVNKAMVDLDYREANQKAGYVYIISNIGAFGENVFKIGMTRRLEPQDRIDELSGASVPFKFDIHAMIFSDDAPKLEAALHNAFSDKKLNLVNGRKEFFRVTLDEIKDVVEKNFDKSVEFKDSAEAEQFRTSEKLRAHIKQE